MARAVRRKSAKPVRGKSAPRRKARGASPRGAGLEALAGALERFGACERFALLRMVQAAPFLPAGHRGLEGLTFGDLIGLGAREIMARANPAAGRRLTRLLGDLAAAGAPTQDAARVVPPEMAVPEAEGGLESNDGFAPHLMAAQKREPELNSIEAEELLRSSLAKVREAECYERVKHLRLERYWPENWLRDPFIEALTFKQITGMKLSHIMEKHSFNQRKLMGIVRAVEGCLAEQAGGGAAARTAIDRCADTRAAAVSDRDVLARPQDPEDWSPPAVALGILTLFDGARAAMQSRSTPLATLIAALPERLSRRELALLWLLADHEEDEAAGLLRLGAPAGAVAAGALSRLRALLAERAPGLQAHWETALGGLGVSAEVLLAPFREEGLSADLQLGVARMLVRALGAVQVSGGFWTLRPELLAGIDGSA